MTEHTRTTLAKAFAFSAMLTQSALAAFPFSKTNRSPTHRHTAPTAKKHGGEDSYGVCPKSSFLV